MSVNEKKKKNVVDLLMHECNIMHFVVGIIRYAVEYNTSLFEWC